MACLPAGRPMTVGHWPTVVPSAKSAAEKQNSTFIHLRILRETKIPEIVQIEYYEKSTERISHNISCR
jgi:hypothetical protein